MIASKLSCRIAIIKRMPKMTARILMGFSSILCISRGKGVCRIIKLLSMIAHFLANEHLQKWLHDARKGGAVYLIKNERARSEKCCPSFCPTLFLVEHRHL